MIGRAILRSGLIPDGTPLVVAVSGGADSVALLAALHSFSRARRWRLTVAHMDHGIRGAASKADADFVMSLAKRWGVPARLGRCNAPLRARRRGQSLEAVAREARYDFLSRVARATRAYAIVTAHTADDQAETVLMNVCRGAGLTGLGGIPPSGEWRGVKIVRPLLGMGHSDLVASLERAGIGWREDETNLDARFTRNRVRRCVMPMLARELNPSIRGALCRMAALCRADARLLDEIARAHLRKAVTRDGAIQAAHLAAEDPATRGRMLRCWLLSRGVPASSLDFEAIARCEALLGDGKASVEAPLDGGCTVKREYGVLRLQSGIGSKSRAFLATVRCPGTTRVDPPGLTVHARMGTGIVRPPRTCAGILPAEASLSAERIGRCAIRVRAWRPGDRMHPFGMKGSRKVQDILTDHKVPRARRSAVPVFECAGEIVWLPGYRIARGWEVPDANARSVHIRVECGRTRRRVRP